MGLEDLHSNYHLLACARLQLHVKRAYTLLTNPATALHRVFRPETLGKFVGTQVVSMPCNPV